MFHAVYFTTFCIFFLDCFSEVIKKDDKYVSFEKPGESEIESIRSKLQYIQNGELLIEDMIGFLFDELSAQVPLGNHYLYTRILVLF